MERKLFLKNGLSALGLISIAPLLDACKKNSSSGTTAGNGTGGTTCTPVATETAGPYPTNSPSSYVRSDIRDGRTGVLLNIKLTIQNTNASCAALAGAIVDVWHCDKDGNYSEYTNNGVNYTSVHFLRGRQVTNANGEVNFTSIFPGWYSGRTTHLHIHIYNASGTSLKITQVAFPEGSNSAVVQVNNSTANGYTKGMSGYTYNANDNIFSDDSTGSQIGAVTGDLATGFTITQIIKVPA